MKSHLQSFLDNNLEWLNTNLVNNPNSNSLGIFISGNGVIAENNGLAISPWQDDLFTSSAGHIADLGFAKAKPLLVWKAKFPTSRLMGPGFCWIQAATYNLNIRASTTSPLFTTISEVYSTMPADFKSLPCGGPETAAYLKLKAGEMPGYSDSAMGFPSNLQPALAYSVDSGYPGAAEAWTVFMNRSVKPDYSQLPQFDILPRH